MNTDFLRNFCILAHIDHGKSTLADRFLEITGTVEKRKMREQFLDQMDLERERGITIKMQPVRMIWRTPNHTDNQLPVASNYQSSSKFILNLIDTPGHVDFSYEVSRALAAVEGAILLVDATQGVQAQTLANLHLAQKEGLIIIPAINKIDLPSADVQKTAEELVGLLGVLSDDIFKISAKTGEGVEELLRAVVEKVPAPRTSYQLPVTIPLPLRALVFDSSYDSYQGVIAHVRIFEGSLAKGEEIFFLVSGARSEAQEVGFFLPGRASQKELIQGEIGYIATGIKEPEKVRVGDTITKSEIRNPKSKIKEVEPLAGYKEPVPVVFASIFPENQDDYELLRESLQKLKLNDAAFVFEPEEAGVLGRGMRAGFLGMLHMEIVAERLKREYNQRLIFSNPSVKFKIKKKNGDEIFIYSAGKLPPPHEIDSIEEPRVIVEVLTPAKFLGVLTTLVVDKNGRINETANLGSDRLLIRFEAPLREIIVDFYDNLKSITQGFASASYDLGGYQKSDLIKIDILVNGERIPAFAEVVPRSKVNFIARQRVKKLKGLLPQALFAIALQVEVEGRVIARETISAFRKDVTGYLYGGDRTRKMKLWKKQQKGKKRLKERGRVDIPPEVFLRMLRK